MTVVMTSEAYGVLPGANYTGPEEAWLLAEGYAKLAGYATKTAAKVTGSGNAVNIVTGGNLVVKVDGGLPVTIALLAADTPAAAATKIGTALAGKADAAIVSSKLEITSIKTGYDASVEIVSGTGTVLANLFVTAGQKAVGADGGIGIASNGPTAVAPVQDPTVDTNREAPFHSTDPGELERDYDFDAGNVDTEAPSQVVLVPKVGKPAGGDVVRILGSNLENVTSVTFGGTAGTALDVTNVDDGEILITTPAKAAGAYNVVLVDASGNTTLVNGFTYVA